MVFSKRLPNRGQFFSTLVAAAAFTLTWLGFAKDIGAKQDKLDRPPNLLLIFSDDHVFGTIGCSGNKVVYTPHLDRLAATGCRFTSATVPSPVCVASRASLLCSLYPQQHGSTFLNNKPFLDKVSNNTLKILPQYLEEAGYVTGLCGKTHMGDPIKNLRFQHGKNNMKYRDLETFSCAESFLDEKGEGDKPFFLMVTPNQPHVPLKPLEKWVEYYKSKDMPIAPNYRDKPLNSSLVNQGKPGEIAHPWNERIRPKTREEAKELTAKYYGEISHLDEQIGSLLKKLADMGLEKNTLVIYLGDNGFHLGNHGLTNKLVMYAESVRVPFIASFPGTIKGREVSGELVSGLDIMPTLLDFAGVPIPDGLEGKSLKPLLTGKETHLRDEIFSECCGINEMGVGHRMVRTKRWKYMLSDVNEEGLFDLKNDPYEMKNLAKDPQYSSQLKRLRKSLADWMDHVGDKHGRPPK